ncbi:TPA: hypothetical protein ACGAEE_001333 [Legionella pneumophila]|nr:hypothetical protein [Legionella pneumophila]
MDKISCYLETTPVAEVFMPSRNLVSDLMFHAKASRRCLRISSARTHSG